MHTFSRSQFFNLMHGVPVGVNFRGVRDFHTTNYYSLCALGGMVTSVFPQNHTTTKRRRTKSYAHRTISVKKYIWSGMSICEFQNFEGIPSK